MENRWRSRLNITCCVLVSWAIWKYMSVGKQHDLGFVASQLQHRVADGTLLKYVKVIADASARKRGALDDLKNHRMPQLLVRHIAAAGSVEVKANITAAVAQICVKHPHLHQDFIRAGAAQRMWNLATDNNMTMEGRAAAMTALAALTTDKHAAAEFNTAGCSQSVVWALQVGAASASAAFVASACKFVVNMCASADAESWLRHLEEADGLVHTLAQIVLTEQDPAVVKEALGALATVAQSAALAEQILHANVHRHVLRLVRKSPDVYASVAAPLLPTWVSSAGVGDASLASAVVAFTELAWQAGTRSYAMPAAVALESLAVGARTEAFAFDNSKADAAERSARALVLMVANDNQRMRQAALDGMRAVAQSRGGVGRQRLVDLGALALLVALAEHGDLRDAAMALPLLALLLHEPSAQTTFLARHDGAAILHRVLSLPSDVADVAAVRQAAALTVLPLASTESGVHRLVDAKVWLPLRKLYTEGLRDEAAAAGLALTALLRRHTRLCSKLAASAKTVKHVKIMLQIGDEAQRRTAMSLVARLATNRDGLKAFSDETVVQRLLASAHSEDPRTALDAMLSLAGSAGALKLMQQHGLSNLLTFSNKAPPDIRARLEALQKLADEGA